MSPFMMQLKPFVDGSPRTGFAVSTLDEVKIQQALLPGSLA